jgi:hypothetical protein
MDPLRDRTDEGKAIDDETVVAEDARRPPPPGP